MSRVAAVLTLALGGLASAYGALLLLDLLARHEVTRAQALALPSDGRLVLDTGSGDVGVEGTGGAPRLVVRAVQGLFGDGEARAVRGGDGRLAVRAECGFLSFDCRASLQVLVPARTALDLRTGSGKIDVEGVQGGLVADTGSGDVSLQDVGGPAVTVDTGSGAITGGGVSAGRLRAQTGSGNVSLVVVRAPDDVDIDTGSGEVALLVPDVVYDVGSETGSGESRVTVRSDSGSPRRLRVKTGSGDVMVRPQR